MTVTSLSLTDSFRHYFKINLALSEEQKQSVYGIRYRVYCEEFGYEPLANFPNQMEFDDFDSRSLHCLVTHKATGRGAGCVRLVFPADGKTFEDLPLGRFCADSLDAHLLAQLCLPDKTICEVSRLAVDGETRTRFGDVDAIDCTFHERRTFSLISVAAFLAATALTDLSGRTNVFAMMEPFLPKLLARSGITFQKIGKEIEYHGYRAPYFSTTSAIDGMQADLRKLYDAIYKEVKSDYLQHLKAVEAVLPKASSQ